MDFSIIMLILLGVALLFGTLFGLKRGRNHSILRLILIIGCVVGAIFLTPVLEEIIYEIDTGNGTVKEMFGAMLGEGQASVPQEMIDAGKALLVAIRLLIYVITFFLLRFVSFIIIFPIIKIFVKKDLIKKRLLGTIIGLIQGIVIAFAVLVPLNGLAVELNTASSFEMEGKKLIEVPKELGLDKYQDSAIYGVLDSIGGWYLDIIEGK